MQLPDTSDVIRNLQYQIADQALRIATLEATLAVVDRQRDELMAELNARATADALLGVAEPVDRPE